MDRGLRIAYRRDVHSGLAEPLALDSLAADRVGTRLAGQWTLEELIGMGGTAILAEMIWADYFGRASLGKIRGMGSLITSLFSAGGPPFFGLLFDATRSYNLSFGIFIGMLFASALVSWFLRPPTLITHRQQPRAATEPLIEN